MAKKQTQRIAIFIDGNNLRHALKALVQSDEIDWKTFVPAITRDHVLSYINFYIGKVTHPLFEKEKVKKQSKLIKQLKNAQVNVWLGYFNEQKLEKGVDVQIALDLAVGAIEDHFDIALLISGDGDLANAVQIAKHFGKRVILGYIAGTKTNNYRVSWRLKSKATGQAALNEQVKKARKIWLKKHPEKQKKKLEVKERKKKGKKQPKEEHKNLLLFADGGARGNPGPAGCGAVITDEQGNIIKKISEYIGEATNNQAEYQALIFALDEVKKLNPKQLTCYLDSKLVVEQVSGRWRVKEEKLKKLHAQVIEYVLKHPNTSFHHIPREKNKQADKLANQAMDKKS